MPPAVSRPNFALYLTGILIIALAAYGPIVQPADYHHFADQRVLFGVAHGGDVLSNLGFLLVAAFGAVKMFKSGRLEPAQAVFFGALALTAAGSTWYHLAPDDARLVWDRLPIALACAALLAATLPKVRLALPGLAVFAVLSVWWWSATGDLRPYLLIQLAPLVLIPLLQWQSAAPVAQRRAFGVAIVLYVLAKLCEVGDQALYDALNFISGHTIKHLLATLAAFTLASQFAGAR